MTDPAVSVRPPLRRRIGPGVRRRFVRLLARAPLALRSSRQLAREARHLGAIQKLAEFGPLVRLLRERSPSVTVEIGTARGGAYYAFCKAAPEGSLLVSVDLPGGNFGGGYGESEVHRFRGFGRPRQSLHFLRVDSHLEETKQDLLRILAGRPIDFLFIDGDHTYEGVKADFEMYAPLVRPGGLIAFHDIVPGDPARVGGVPRFWAEVKNGREVIEYVRDWNQGGLGIGVLEIDGR